MVIKLVPFPWKISFCVLKTSPLRRQNWNGDKWLIYFSNKFLHVWLSLDLYLHWKATDCINTWVTHAICATHIFFNLYFYFFIITFWRRVLVKNLQVNSVKLWYAIVQVHIYFYFLAFLSCIAYRSHWLCYACELL